MIQGARTEPAATRHLIWTIGLLSTFGPLATDMYLPGLPALTRSLHASASAGQLTLTASVLGIALGQLLFGAASDARGRRLPLLAGLVAFTAASVLCAACSTIWLLIVFRFLQGVAGAAGVVIGRAVLRDVFSGTAAARAFATMATINGISPIIAPLIGGAILSVTSWRGVFVALTAIGAALLLLVLRAVPETLPANSRHTGGLGATLRTFGELLTDRGFAPAAATYAFAFGTLFAYISGGSYALENIYRVSPQGFSAIFAVNSAGIILLSLLSGRVVHRLGPDRLLRAGTLGVAIGAALTLLACAVHADLWLLLVSLLLVASSMGLVLPNGVTVAMESSPDALGSASGLLGMGQFGVGALVAPLVGLGGSHDATPMGIVMLASALVALAINLTLMRRPV